MKTHKVFLLALVASAAVAFSAQAGSHHASSGSQAASPPAFHSGAGFRSGGGRMIAPSQRFSSRGMVGVRRYYTNSGRSLSQRRVTPGTFNRSNSFARSGTSRAQSSRGSRANLIGNTNRTGRGNHVFARRTANWHRDWDHHHDHWWHGHRCRFVNGYWFVFDLGFLPWYGYPYDYYAYDDYYGYPYGYQSDVYESEPADYYGQGSYDSNQSADSFVASAQERLARQGYYRGEIDGVFGPETRRATMRYQSDKGLAPTGRLTTETLASLGVRRVAAAD